MVFDRFVVAEINNLQTINKGSSGESRCSEV